MSKLDKRRAEQARKAAQLDERRRVTLRVHEACDRIADSIVSRAVAAGKPPSCAPGCAACCHQAILIPRCEAEVLVATIATWSAEDQAALRARLVAWLAWYHGAGDLLDGTHTLAAWITLRSPGCVLLSADRSCTAYAARPVTCRSLYVTSPPSACEPGSTAGPVRALAAIVDGTREAAEDLRRVVENQGGSFDATMHLLPEWLAHLLDVEREPWRRAPAALEATRPT